MSFLLKLNVVQLLLFNIIVIIIFINKICQIPDKVRIEAVFIINKKETPYKLLQPFFLNLV